MITKNDLRLGKQIQKYRKEARLTQEQLADKVKLTTKYIQLIENANRQPSLKALYKIAQSLNIKVQDLFPF